MMTANEKVIEAKANANVNDADSMKALFNAVANEAYINGTKKSFEQLDKEGYISYNQNSWANGCNGDEWESIEDCEMAAESAADAAIEEESNQD